MKRVFFWHLKALGYCNRQMRVWCKSHGYSWVMLRKEGIDADYLLSIDDSSMSHKAVDFAASTGWSKDPITAESNDKNGGCV